MDETARHRFEELKAGGQLPSPRGVALAVMEIVRHPEAKIRDIVRLVQTDPAMTGRILRYANTGRAGSRPIVSLGQAITFLGLYRVRQIALGFSLIDEYRSGACPAFDYERYWGASLATAIAAQKLAAIAQTPPDESFTCGLLAGIGRLALATVFPDAYAQILEQRPDRERLLAAEKQRFGLDHAELSAEMVASWGVPAVFVQAVRHHEAPYADPSDPGTRARTLTAVLHLASRIGRMLNPGTDDEEAALIFDTAAQVGIDRDEVRPLLERVTADWTEWMKELALRARPAVPLGDLLEAASRPVVADREQALAQMRVALVVSDAHCRARIAALLDALKVSYATHASASEIDAAAPVAPQAVFVDLGRPERMRELDSLVAADLPVVVVIPPAAESGFPQLMEMGAMDYLVGDFSESALIARLMSAQRVAALRSAIRSERESAINASRQWAQANRRLLHEALTDPLTQLPNRRYGLDRFAEEWAIAVANELPIACLMLDIDHFKQVNDRHGHDVGDRVLYQLARTLEGGCRRSDVLFRYGGEEFCCVCPGTGMAEAEHLAQRLLEAVRAGRFGREEKPFRVTLSIGAAVRTDRTRQPAELIAVADKALYLAKQGGRDRIAAR